MVVRFSLPNAVSRLLSAQDLGVPSPDFVVLLRLSALVQNLVRQSENWT